MSNIETRSKKSQSVEKEYTEESRSSSRIEQTSSTEQNTATERTTETEHTMNSKVTAQNVKVSDAKLNLSKRTHRRGSQASHSKRAELEARLELQRLQIAKADAEAAAARTRLDLAQLADQSDLEEDTDAIDLVDDCDDEDTTYSKSVDTLAKILTRVIKTNGQENAPRKPPVYMSELPPFDGDPTNWIPFIKHYTSTATYFIDIENIARIRKALKGQGKEAVKSLLYTSSSPDNILKELERRFGQPTYIIRGLITELHKLPRMPEDLKGIGTFASAVFNTVDTIKQLNQLEYLYSTEIVDQITDKMSTLVKFRWQEFKANRRKEPMLNVLSDFLIKISNDFDEPGQGDKPKMIAEYNKSRPFRKTRVNVAQHDTDSDASYDSEFEEEMRIVLAASTIEDETCPLCGQQHNIAKCAQFLKEDTKDRWDTVKKLNVCFKCLKTNHRHLTCKSKPCAKDGCTRSHHELLHQDRPEINKIVSVNHVGTSTTYLKIVPVEINGPDGTATVMALLDEGSTVTLLLNEVADRIGATGPNRSLLIEGIGGQQIKARESRHIKLRVKGLFSRNYENLQAQTINQLNLRTQSITQEDIQNYIHLKGIEDQLIYDGSPPALLIGQDNWHLIVTRDLKTGNPSEPVASLTSLGWILHGYKSEFVKPILFVNHVFERKADDIDEQIKDHFSLDSCVMPITRKKPTNDPEQRALDITEKTTHLHLGRFEYGLLWRTDHETKPLNRDNAMHHFKGIESKLNKNEYNEHIKNVLRKGYTEPATKEPTSPRTWYLPHFTVIHPQKGKIRLVFDVAERTNSKILNDAPLSGPDLLQSLFGLLVSFRQGPVAVAADIKEIFLKIRIREEERYRLRFLWTENEMEDGPREYGMKPLIFGATSSPYSAIFVKNQNTQDSQEKYPAATNAIQRCHYMDDDLQSSTTAKDALKTSEEVVLLHEDGSSELTVWTSNDPATIRGLENNPPGNLALGDHDKCKKTLGMQWDTSRYALEFKQNLCNTHEDVRSLRPPTKVACAVRKPPDKANPVLIQGKRPIQPHWREGIGWDEPLPKRTIEQWVQWFKSLGLVIPYMPSCTHSQDEGELHTVVDASECVCTAAVRSEPPNISTCKKKKKHTVTAMRCIETTMPNVKRLSSWTRFVRAVAHLLQSVDRFKPLERDANVTPTKRIT